MPDKILFKTKWISVLETENGFQYLERKGTNSVAIILIRYNSENSGNWWKCLVRWQPLPLDNTSDQTLFPCPITGSIDEGEDPKDCAIREVEEETGIVIHDRKDIWEIGNYIVGTQTNETVFMFMAFLEDGLPEKVRGKGDGTFFENISENEWRDFEELKDYKYSACQIMYYKIKEFWNRFPK